MRYKMVPVEPTEEMIRAADALQDYSAIHNYGGSPSGPDYQIKITPNGGSRLYFDDGLVYQNDRDPAGSDAMRVARDHHENREAEAIAMQARALAAEAERDQARSAAASFEAWKFPEDIQSLNVALEAAEARALAAEAERDKFKAELEELDFLRHEGGPDSVAAIEAERDRLINEREQLALAICGGEDAPGYANAQTVETLEKIAERSRREAREEYERAAGDRADATAARKQVRRYRDALYRIAGGTNYADDPWDIARFALREDLP
jgi:hypothetical protein